MGLIVTKMIMRWVCNDQSEFWLLRMISRIKRAHPNPVSVQKWYRTQAHTLELLLFIIPFCYDTIQFIIISLCGNFSKLLNLFSSSWALLSMDPTGTKSPGQKVEALPALIGSLSTINPTISNSQNSKHPVTQYELARPKIQ